MDNQKPLMDNALHALNYPIIRIIHNKHAHTFLDAVRYPVPITIDDIDNYIIYIEVKSALSPNILYGVIAQYQNGYFRSCSA